VERRQGEGVEDRRRIEVERNGVETHPLEEPEPRVHEVVADRRDDELALPLRLPDLQVVEDDVLHVEGLEEALGLELDHLPDLVLLREGDRELADDAVLGVDGGDHLGPLEAPIVHDLLEQLLDAHRGDVFAGGGSSLIPHRGDVLDEEVDESKLLRGP
jgi:hypothetical protein